MFKMAVKNYKNTLDDVFINSLPTLDLHGETRDSARMLVKEFIYDNYVLRNEKVVIVHGVGTGALKDETYKMLKHDKKVLDYHLNHYNIGCTLVYIKKRLD